MSAKKVLTGLLGESLAFYASRNGNERTILILESADGALRAREFLSAYMPVIGPKSAEDPLTTREGFLDLARVILERRRSPQFTVLSAFSACSVLPEIHENDRIIRKNQAVERDDLLRGLRSLGYDQVSPCLDPGDFSFRGDIVDWIDPAGTGCRVEIPYSKVEQLYIFDTETGKNITAVEALSLHPAHPHAIFVETAKMRPKSPSPAIQNSYQVFLDEGLLSPVLSRRIGKPSLSHRTVLDQLGEGDIIIEENIELASRIEFWIKARPEEKKIPYFSVSENLRKNKSITWARLFSKPGEKGKKLSMSFPLTTRGQVVETLADLRKKGKRRVFVCTYSRPEYRKYLEENLAPLKKYKKGTVKPGFYGLPGVLERSFSIEEENHLFLSYEELMGKTIAPAGKRRRTRGHFLDIGPGDYVVHLDHGLGRFHGLVRKVLDRREKEFLDIEYAGGARLFVPVEQIALISKYIGEQKEKIKLDSLNTSEWKKKKTRAKRRIRRMARGILRLEALRKSRRGFPFSKEGKWQREFNALFPFRETEDQTRVWREIQKDMEKDSVMDRMLIGDVGFGKTEIILRAAFKATLDGKQTAVLVPTTLLASQHLRVFRERMSQFPIRVESMSRHTQARKKDIQKDIADGKIDILIGTHTLLGKSINFKNLGLLVIDEEHRFGVKQKERLKERAALVDCMSLSATPIPRSLFMTLSGMRPASYINTPPLERKPIETFVVRDTDEVIKEAITRELDRGGQVFYLRNEVRFLEKEKTRLEKLFPDVPKAVAHGQMPKKEMERIMDEFLDGKIRILVTSSIIEAGIDIPSVNTIIIQKPQRFGLASLYQIRGRVGRGARQAFCYLLLPTQLASKAQARLLALREFTELGKGGELALRDLDLRGAGNLLGEEQHGEILTLGIELYAKLLESESSRLKGKRRRIIEEPRIILSYRAYLEENIFTDSRERLSSYKRIMGAKSLRELRAIEEEITDLYGQGTEPRLNLFGYARLRIICGRIGIRTLRIEKGLWIEFSEDLEIGIIESRKKRIVKAGGTAGHLVGTLPFDKKGLGEIAERLRKVFYSRS